MVLAIYGSNFKQLPTFLLNTLDTFLTGYSSINRTYVRIKISIILKSVPKENPFKKLPLSFKDMLVNYMFQNTPN